MTEGARPTAIVTGASSGIGAAGDANRAASVDAGVTPLTADDVADCVTFAVTRPSHVDIDSMVVLARDQAGARDVHRHPTDPPRP